MNERNRGNGQRSSSSSSTRSSSEGNGGKRQRLVAWTVTVNGENEFWHPIGSAFKNNDGSLTVRLHALPLDGKVIIRKPRPKDGEREPGDE
jgi:hypothetical protein